MTESKEIITLTSAAKNRIKEIITKAEKNYIGIRIGIDNTGCSGYSYKINYAEKKIDGDEEISVDKELIDKIFKFASIKHILSNHKNDNHKVLELLEEIIRDLKNYELEFRIEELESQFSKDLSESTFNEIRELKKLQYIN